MAPRPVFLPSGQDVTKVSQLMAMIASTQPAWEAGASCTGEMGMGHRGAFLTLLSVPWGRSEGMSRRKAPLHDNNLLRKKDLGLTLTETSFQEPAGTDGVGRASQEGAKPWCNKPCDFCGWEDEQAYDGDVLFGKALVLLAGGQGCCAGVRRPGFL